MTATATGGTRAAVAVEIPSMDPIADFLIDISYLNAILIDNSSDEDGSVASRRWDFGDGTTSTDTDPNHTYDNGGTYTVTLTVTDNCGNTDSAEELILVEANEPPLAGFTYNFINNLNVQFTDASTDKENAIESRLWDFGDGTTSPDTDPSHIYEGGGTYTVTLTVADERDASDSESIDITVEASIIPPMITDFTFAASGLTIQFSESIARSVMSRQWDFGDGNTSEETDPSHTYAAEGTYTVQLTVTYEGGGSDTISKEVNVESDLVTPDQETIGSGGNGGGGCFIDDLYIK